MLRKAAFLPPEDLAKLVLEVAAGGVEVVQVGQDAAFSRGTFGRVHARLHYDAQPGNRRDWNARQRRICFISVLVKVVRRDEQIQERRRHKRRLSQADRWAEPQVPQ